MSRATPLLLQIVTGDPRPINRQITDGVKRLIAAGELAIGAAVPSVRALAAQLGINPNTVAKAYAELAAEGWLDTRAGLGAFVAQPRQRLSAAERERRLNDAVDRFVGDVIGLDFPNDAVLDRVATGLAQLAPRKSA
jgi:GntR family transcriptional regulator